MRTSRHIDNWQRAMVVSLLLGIMFSAVVFNVLHARAAFFDAEFESTGLGEDGPYSEICGAQFDLYLLSAEKWKGRISNFAERIFDDMAGQFLSYLRCNAFFIDFGFGGTSSKGPRCNLDMKDVEAAAVEASERELTYDLLTKCTATAAVQQTSNDTVRIMQENGPEGGVAWIQDWHDEAPKAAQLGTLKACNDFANTQWCPWIKADIEALVGGWCPTDEPRPIDDEMGREFARQMSCAYPEGTELSDLEGDPFWEYESSLPTNDSSWAYLIADQHLSARISYEIEVSRDRNIAQQGLTAIYGSTPEESCAGEFVNGVCLKRDTIKVPAVVSRDFLFLANQAEYDIAISADDMGEMMSDLRPRMTSRAQDLTAPVLELDFELDLATTRYQNSDPEDNTIPVRPPPDPTITGVCGAPSPTDCRCLQNPGDQGGLDAQIIARNLLSESIGKAGFANSRLFTNDRLSPNNFAEFVLAVCFELRLSAIGCRVSASSPDVLIFQPGGGGDMAVRIIRGDGLPLVTNPVALFTCVLGVLP